MAWLCYFDKGKEGVIMIHFVPMADWMDDIWRWLLRR